MRTIFAIALALLSQGCLNCTLVGCQNGLTVDLTGSTDPGLYTIEVIADDLTHVCSFELGVDGCEGAHWIQIAAVSESGVLIQIPELKPESVVILIDRDGDVLADVALSPVYKVSYPNGERCGTKCDSAYEDVAY